MKLPELAVGIGIAVIMVPRAIRGVERVNGVI